MKYFIILLILVGFGMPVFAETGLTETSVLTEIKIIEFGMFDSEDYENMVHQLYVGKKYWFWFEYQNESEKPQDIEEFVKLIDKNKTKDNILQKIEGSTTLESFKGLGSGFSWTPEYVGEFEITAKVISPDDSLVGVIAPQYDLVVIERPLLKQQLQNQVPIDNVLCKKSDHFLSERTNKKLACVSLDAAKKLGWKLVHFEEIILDPATKESLLERYSDLPEVVAFYEKYPDTIEEIRDDHISYVTGSDEGFKVRMKLFFDENYELDHIDFNCYFQREHQNDVPESFILRYLKDFECEKRSAPAIVIIPYGSASPENQFHLIPEEITVVLGKNSTVMWRNQDDFPSTLTSDSSGWSTGVINPGESAYVMFNETGVYPYHGEPHPWKVGKVIVLAD